MGPNRASLSNDVNFTSGRRQIIASETPIVYLFTLGISRNFRRSPRKELLCIIFCFIVVGKNCLEKIMKRSLQKIIKVTYHPRGNSHTLYQILLLSAKPICKIIS